MSHAGLGALVVLCSSLMAQTPADPESGLVDIRRLMAVEVTSVSKKAQPLSRSAASIYIITAEDIRRSGADSIPEALRMAPGLAVARVGPHKWAIGSRGFNGRFANKLLVLVDGRSVYSPVFAGIYWDVEDVFLKDIARIEVIRGPGAAIWGANAVNGVVNIVTKRASETQGGFVTATGGTSALGAAGVRYGGEVGSEGLYRVYGQARHEGDASTPNGPGRNGWSTGRAGVRADWQKSSEALTVEGDVYAARERDITNIAVSQPPYILPTADTARTSGGNALARWSHTETGGSTTSIQMYTDLSRRDDPSGDESVSTFDVELQHGFRRRAGQAVQFGLEGRFTSATVHLGHTAARLDPWQDAWSSAFVQDEISLWEDRLTVTAGSRFERTPSTGLETQPALQVAWTPSNAHTFWFSGARAVRTPSLVDRAADLDMSIVTPGAGLPVLLRISGNPRLRSERLFSWQAGHRARVADSLAIDVTGFYSRYGGLRTTEGSEPFFVPAPFPHLEAPMTAENTLAATSYGVELSSAWQPLANWKLNASYSWLRVLPQPSPSGNDGEAERIDRDNPRNQAQLRSYLDLGWRINLDTALYYVSALEEHRLGIPRPRIPGYARVDVRFARRLTKDVELIVGGRDLLNRERLEFIDMWGSGSQPANVGRQVYGKVAFRF